MAIKKAIFLTHPNALKSEFTGGVQLCSQEFHQIIAGIEGISLTDYFVPYTKNLLQRIQMKLGLENYSMYDAKKDSPELIKYIRDNKIDVVFINMSSLVRYSKFIKANFADSVKVVLLSHGNHSGDFLHLITKPVVKPSILRQFLNKLRLGLLISTEADYRVKHLDAVVALSETEKQIENWFGGKKVIFLPRRLYTEFLPFKPVIGRIGFVGRLDHPPNLQGVSILLDAIQKMDHSTVEFRLVGAPESNGQQLAGRYPFIKYLGELSDKALEEEVASWAVFTNPVWWYSTGASTKLARAISWGVPIVSSTAGMRGYSWKSGSIILADSPAAMAVQLLQTAVDSDKINYWANQIKIIAASGLSGEELAALMNETYQ
jgi:glycosyltransferase involved in cell wall biosynthesis